MRVAVVGGGISGLVAAYRVRKALGDAAELVLIERRDRVGGILRTVEIEGDPVDLGAEAFVGRRPEIPELMGELGIGDQLVYPAGKRPLVWSQGSGHRLPERTLMGIPGAAESVAGLVDAQTLAVIADEPNRPMAWQPGGDVSVGELVRDRFGEQVVRRSVDPLLGGVYAGLADSIGVRAALPPLAAALDRGATSLTQAVSDALPAPGPTPVFGGIRDGYRVLLDALREAADVKVEIGTAATGLTHTAAGWRLDPVGEVDAVILATPAPVTAELLRGVAPEAAALAAGIELASSAVVAMALPAETALPDNSGILVATGEPLRAKAFTLSSRKWPHLAARDVALVRASFGRFGDDSPLSWPDDDLIEAAVEDLATVTGLEIRPLRTFVQRWPGGLPQYAPGHTTRIADLRSATADLPGLALAGAYLDGVGVPACAASGTVAAARIAEHLA
ncbi:protoporphyrinogen oxidase [Nocardia seriolae]|uniref:Coproporphyrinogen III oxidase n=1 Tax=Nocardia seriolae TaxID=37332 RepID=A0ABC9YXP0_9NOCA|nr:protoporphyrinogen oxidase [Nocardia seriolae]BEK94819.1 protoporphyrinogen oxidase [Nocardia seriolae]GAM48303.1 protoporphyrinogen oxidase [Nocardia seriolae]GAP30235.1 protoporphyrinogen oxidase [Nocardia seriolae]